MSVSYVQVRSPGIISMLCYVLFQRSEVLLAATIPVCSTIDRLQIA